jgi:hypothetical protein
MRESAVRSAVSNRLRLRGWMVHNVEDRANAGLPDAWAAHAQFGQCWIEFKRWRRSAMAPSPLRPAQARWMREALLRGVRVVIVSNAPQHGMYAYSAPARGEVERRWQPDTPHTLDELCARIEEATRGW